MNKSHVRNSNDALAYLVDCTLATVSRLAFKRSRTKYEYRRQIEIAQLGMNWMRDFKIPLEGRAADVAHQFNWSVENWAENMERMA